MCLCVPVWNLAFVQQRIYDIIKHWDKDKNQDWVNSLEEHMTQKHNYH